MGQAAVSTLGIIGFSKSWFGFFSSSKPIFYEPGVIKIKLFISINALIFIYPEP
jgi:hypothetical protein